jgi:hypothetical protein
MNTLRPGHRLATCMWLVHPVNQRPDILYPDPGWREEETTPAPVSFTAPVRVFPSRQAAEFVAASNPGLTVSGFHVAAQWREDAMEARLRTQARLGYLRHTLALLVLASLCTALWYGLGEGAGFFAARWCAAFVVGFNLADEARNNA